MHRAPEPLIRYVTKKNIKSLQRLTVIELKLGMKLFLGVDFIHVMREAKGSEKRKKW